MKVIVGCLIIAGIILALISVQDKYDTEALGMGFICGWFVGLITMIIAIPGP